MPVGLRDHPNLLDVCQADTLFIDVELKNYQSGSAPGGSGPSFAEWERKRHHVICNLLSGVE